MQRERNPEPILNGIYPSRQPLDFQEACRKYNLWQDQSTPRGKFIDLEAETAHSTLLQLPQELLDLVATYLARTDLLTLRRVNREIASKTQYIMLKQNFSKLRILTSVEDSLKRALSIAQHPVLSLGVENVHVYNDVFNREHGTCPRLLLPSSGSGCKYWTVYLYTSWVEAETRLSETGTGLSLLKRIFASLRLHERPLRMTFNPLCPDDEVGDAASSRDYRDLCKAMKKKIQMVTPVHHRTLENFITALGESDVHPHALELGSTDYGIPLPLLQQSTSLDIMYLRFDRLTSLHLFLRQKAQDPDPAWMPIVHDPNDTYTEKDGIGGLLRLLKVVASHLVDFRLETSIETDGWTLDNVFLALQEEIFFPALQHLQLCDMHVDYDVFLNYLVKHKATLRSCGFSAVTTPAARGLTEQVWEKCVAADFESLGLPVLGQPCGISA